jgi:hypothetical protein
MCFGGAPKPPAIPAPPPPPPAPEDPAVKKAADDAKMAASKRRGFGSTVRTSGLGDTSEASTQRQTLLG